MEADKQEEPMAIEEDVTTEEEEYLLIGNLRFPVPAEWKEPKKNKVHCMFNKTVVTGCSFSGINIGGRK
jgi:hypothetical protein